MRTINIVRSEAFRIKFLDDKVLLCKMSKKRPLTMFQRLIQLKNKRIGANKKLVATKDMLLLSIEVQIFL